MRGWRGGLVALPLAVLLGGCYGNTGEPPDEVGTNKPGTFGQPEAAPRPQGLGADTTDVPDDEAGTINPPEGYRDREQVTQETPATPGPQWDDQNQQLEGGQGTGAAQPGAEQPAGFEEQGQGQAQQPQGANRVAHPGVEENLEGTNLPETPQPSSGRYRGTEEQREGAAEPSPLDADEAVEQPAETGAR